MSKVTDREIRKWHKPQGKLAAERREAKLISMKPFTEPIFLATTNIFKYIEEFMLKGNKNSQSH